MGTPPDRVRWGIYGENVYFSWNPEKDILPADYKFSIEKSEIIKLSTEEKKDFLPRFDKTENKNRTRVLYTRNGNLYLLDKLSRENTLLLDLSEEISGPFYSKNEDAIFFLQENNLFKYSPEKSTIRKITNIVKESKKDFEKKNWSNDQEEWLYKDQMAMFDILKLRNEQENKRKQEREELKDDPGMEYAYTNNRISDFGISGDERFVSFLEFNRNEKGKSTEMPQYVTESGFTKTRQVRSKVGYSYGEMKLVIMDLVRDTFYYADASKLPGIKEEYEYGEDQKKVQLENNKSYYISSPTWSPEKDKLIVNIRSTDNKDRWIALVDLETGVLKNLDWQHDEAWIAGPGMGWSTSSGTLAWLDDNKTIYFQSEESGYSHLYSYDVEKDKKKAITKGKFEIYNPILSKDKQHFYFTSNMKDPGERHFYRLNVKGGKAEQISIEAGNHDVSLSPDEKMMVIRYSNANTPWELYMRRYNSESDSWSSMEKITDSYSDEFLAYPWRVPEFIHVTARDGEKVPARLYLPDEKTKNGAAVVFVHGAGYLQNAHKWWSNYYREFMFHNFLVDNGYTVLDMDYRGSAGYGRDWRTGIYRHMGGKDLSDNVDGAKYLVESHGIYPQKLGIYGGSYGGFISIMAQFTSPGTFKAGAALRPVTDWAHYNHGYTSNILNTPFNDSVSYRRSSPIYFANGLQDHLLMCHGMEDDNVHFQDVVRLSQRLIELQKDNWELAVYPLEPHGFKEWTSWLDEYKRIYKLFEETLLDQ